MVGELSADFPRQAQLLWSEPTRNTVGTWAPAGAKGDGARPMTSTLRRV